MKIECPLCGHWRDGLDYHHWEYYGERRGTYICRVCHEITHAGLRTEEIGLKIDLEKKHFNFPYPDRIIRDFRDYVAGRFISVMIFLDMDALEIMKELIGDEIDGEVKLVKKAINDYNMPPKSACRGAIQAKCLIDGICRDPEYLERYLYWVFYPVTADEFYNSCNGGQVTLDVSSFIEEFHSELRERHEVHADD